MCMKKLILVLGLAVATSLNAATHVSQSFLSGNVSSLFVTNAGAGATYGGGVTNLLVTALFAGTPTNVAGTKWTNSAGTQITVNNYSTSTNTWCSVNPLAGIEMWPRVDGSWDPPTFAMNGVYNVWSTTNLMGDQLAATNFATSQSLFIQGYAVNSAADAVVNFRFAPSPDGVRVSTAASDIWTVGIVPPGVTGGSFSIRTNIPTYKWPGCKQLWLIDINNTDTTANSGVFFNSVTANGWRP